MINFSSNNARAAVATGQSPVQGMSLKTTALGLTALLGRAEALEADLVDVVNIHHITKKIQQHSYTEAMRDTFGPALEAFNIDPRKNAWLMDKWKAVKAMFAKIISKVRQYLRDLVNFLVSMATKVKTSFDFKHSMACLTTVAKNGHAFNSAVKMTMKPNDFSGIHRFFDIYAKGTLATIVNADVPVNTTIDSLNTALSVTRRVMAVVVSGSRNYVQAMYQTLQLNRALKSVKSDDLIAIRRVISSDLSDKRASVWYLSTHMAFCQNVFARLSGEFAAAATTGVLKFEVNSQQFYAYTSTAEYRRGDINRRSTYEMLGFADAYYNKSAQAFVVATLMEVEKLKGVSKRLNAFVDSIEKAIAAKKLPA